MAAKPRDNDALMTEGLARTNDVCDRGRVEKTKLAASHEEIVFGPHFCGARDVGCYPLSARLVGSGPLVVKGLSGEP